MGIEVHISPTIPFRTARLGVHAQPQQVDFHQLLLFSKNQTNINSLIPLTCASSQIHHLQPSLGVFTQFNQEPNKIPSKCLVDKELRETTTTVRTKESVV